MTHRTKNGPSARLMADNKRLHLQHGPIDLIIEAFGEPEDVSASYIQAVRAFDDILDDLVSELDLLRSPCARISQVPKGVVAKAMWQAAMPYCEQTFLTPMIAVAGAVADHILENMRAGLNLAKAYVNNGGDIALYLADGEKFEIGVCDDLQTGEHAAKITIHEGDNIGGIATSGWRGRSQSLGIADAVTVLARTGAQADVAATLIANAVNVQSPAISRKRARDVFADSDLGDMLVTENVAALTQTEIADAIANGCKVANDFRDRGLIEAAFISLKGTFEAIGETDRLMHTAGKAKLAVVGQQQENAGV